MLARAPWSVNVPRPLGPGFVGGQDVGHAHQERAPTMAARTASQASATSSTFWPWP